MRNFTEFHLTVINVRLHRWYPQVLAEILHSRCIQLRLRKRRHRCVWCLFAPVFSCYQPFVRVNNRPNSTAPPANVAPNDVVSRLDVAGQAISTRMRTASSHDGALGKVRPAAWIGLMFICTDESRTFLCTWRINYPSLCYHIPDNERHVLTITGVTVHKVQLLRNRYGAYRLFFFVYLQRRR